MQTFEGRISEIEQKSKGKRIQIGNLWYSYFGKQELKQGQDVFGTWTFDKSETYKNINEINIQQPKIEEKIQKKTQKIEPLSQGEGAFFGMVFNQTCNALREAEYARSMPLEQQRKEFNKLFDEYWNLAVEKRNEKFGR